MEKPQETAAARALRRRLSSVRVAIRMMQDELDMSGEGRITLDRTLAEDLVTSLELFVEDVESDAGVARPAVAPALAERRVPVSVDKPVPRLN